MKIFTFYSTLTLCLIFALGAYSQDYDVQHLQDDIGNSGGTNTSFTAVASLNNAVALASSNRKSTAGCNGCTGNLEGDDLAGARTLTATGTLTYYRESSSITSNMRFNTSIMEYIGPSGGNNEMIVRGRYAITLNGTTNSTTQSLSGISNAADCIPFITGIMNNSTTDDADSGSAIAYLENSTTLRVRKGSNGNNVTVYVTVVEFTGSNWTILHGDSGSVSADTGTVTLRDGADGTGTATDVSDWAEAVIFSQHIGDTGASGTNDAIADNWPVMDLGSDDQSVDWTFHGDHDSAGTNRHFVHVLNNTGLSVTRYQNTSSTSGETTIDITSAGLSNTNEALIVGSSTSSGTGTAYGRGYRNYYLNSSTQAAHWSHRSGNTNAHEIQIVDLSGLTSVTPPEMNIVGNSNNITDGATTTSLFNDTEFYSDDTSTNVSHIFTIQNTAAASSTLNLTGGTAVTISGASEFTISAQPGSTAIAGGASTTFTVLFNPTDETWKTATISIANDDSDENPYTFNVRGIVSNIDNFGRDGEWKYLDDGSDQGTAWKASSFNDASWSSGDAELGFGDGDETTTITDVNQITNYFRKTFEVTAVEAAYSTLVLEGLRDDGMVVYLNGTEVWRDNMPTGTIAYNTLASSNVGAAAETAWHTTTLTNTLTTGTNVIAVEVHQDLATSSDVSFNFDLKVRDYIVAAGGSWKYLDDGTDQGTSWQGTGFDDSSWASGNAELGYGNSSETTTVSYGSDANNKYATTYFRKTFTATAAEAANNKLHLEMVIDDGAVVYINGTKVWMFNMPLTYDYSSYAEEAIGGAEESRWWTYELENLLVTGSNTIAVEAHQINATSSDLGFNFGMYVSNDDIYTPISLDNDSDTAEDWNDGDDDNDGVTDLMEGCVTADMEDLNTTGGEDVLSTGWPYSSTLSDGNTITYSVSDINDFNSGTGITSYEAGNHGWGLRVSGADTDGLLTITFTTDVDNLFFRLVDFDEDEQWTVNVYDDSNNLIDLTTAGIAHLGYHVEQTGNSFRDRTTSNGDNVNGDDYEWDIYGAAYFYFPNDTVERIELSTLQNVGSTIRIVGIQYCNQDTDGDGIEDYFDSDSDNDSIPDIVEAGGVDTVGDGQVDTSTDTDKDGLLDVYDTNPSAFLVEDPSLITDDDFDGDSTPNRIDLDSDNDGIVDLREVDEDDTDGDGQIDSFTDTNDDGYHDAFDGANSRLITGSDTGSDGIPDSFPNKNTDGTGRPNFSDIDSDDDGITDNTEAQATGSYVTYGTTDTDGDGITNVFDGTSGFGGDGLIPIDTDFDCIPDYKDTNSDDDTEDDDIEGHDTNGDGVVNGSDSPNADTGLFVGTDTDNDGLDNGFDNADSSFDATNTSLQATDHPNADSLYNRDWRASSSPIDFDGVNDFIDFGDQLDITGPFSIEAWILQQATPASESAIVSKRDSKSGNERGYHLSINSSNRPNLKWYNGSGSTILDLTSSYSIVNNKWHHVAATYNGSVAKIYIDGLEVASSNITTSPVAGTEKFLIGGMYDSDDCTDATNYFSGYIDEVRVWNSGISEQQIREMMNQEVQINGSAVRGTEIPIDITGSLTWSGLRAYYNLNNGRAEDQSSNSNHGFPKNIGTVELQTAPLPYTTKANGNWNDTTASTPWTYGDTVWDEPNSVGVDGATTIDWNIVQTDHDVEIANDDTLGREREVLGLIVNTNELRIDGLTADGEGNGLTVSKYLKLDGTIDLAGESQLIQTDGSILDVTSSGTLERDQQGTADLYTYNYWSSPVGISNTTSNNNNYAMTDVLSDGTLPSSPATITFITSSYDGTSGSPIGIADYWIWKFANQLDDDYSAWQHVRSTGTINAGEGYTMKGPGTGPISSDQNYVYNGKPNNGDISLTINNGNDYLVGNPYPSAIDADEFINDNASITGTLYFWEHWGGGSHILQEYQGGYGTYNLSGGAPAAAPDPDVAQTGVGTKTPGQYIPVSQGFFVIGNANGTIDFENDQRIFIKEDTNSVFMGQESIDDIAPSRTTNTGNEPDDRIKIRIGFNSVNSMVRQLLVTADPNATENVDFGYDAILYDNHKDDLFWMIDDDKYVIQGISQFDIETVLPLGIRVANDGLNTIKLDAVENSPSSDFEIYLLDKELDIYHKLNESEYEFYAVTGLQLERFEIRFKTNLLSTNEFNHDVIDIHYSNAEESIVLVNPTLIDIQSIELYNIVGQSITKINNIDTKEISEFEVRNLSAGSYVLKINTLSGNFSKKVLVE